MSVFSSISRDEDSGADGSLSDFFSGDGELLFTSAPGPSSREGDPIARAAASAAPSICKSSDTEELRLFKARCRNSLSNLPFSLANAASSRS